ncbi:PI-PLC X domain-containing protein 3 isoform X2 [Nilaparvata lugens]|uniref:PI-PLC X domain-containing protein 3 isoform X2 n=1 Tax=Nilaparvata lugens TaxID=108931 RepID=UPI00193EA268|nr:PI-PLC X domain-containing protein 3 isoform X2 [Nilaparvata lugens]
MKMGKHPLTTGALFYLMVISLQLCNGSDPAPTFLTTDQRTYPRWMENYWEYIHAEPLNMLFLPGTHDSASFEGHHEARSVWDSIKKSTPGISDQSFCQDSSIKEQLMLGVRYFDVRVKRDGNDYWTCHGIITMEKLDKVIADVVEFVTKTSKEIVIFDVHQLVSGVVSDDEHRNLANFLKNKFTVDNHPIYVNPSDFGYAPWKSTPDQILAKGKVIVAYINVEFQRKDNCGILWPKVYQYWGEKTALQDLQKFIYEKIPGRIQRNEFTDRLTVIMAELTGDLKSTIMYAAYGLDDQAQDNDDHIQQWFLDPQIGMNTNGVAVDYFRSSGILRLAIMWNERKFFKTNNCDPPQKFCDEYYQKILINI